MFRPRAMMQDLTERGGSVLRYAGSNGRLRVSVRHLDEMLSTADVPAHSLDRVEKLQPGEIVDIKIDLFPIGVAFYPGEQLQLVVSSRNDSDAIMPGTPGYIPDNKGQHIIHTGDCTHRTCNSLSNQLSVDQPTSRY